jgi:serine/threonine-protein kinase
LPDLRGQTLEEAQRLLEPLKVTLVEVNKPGVFHDQVPAGHIVEQAPPPETVVQPGSTVRVTLSRGRAVQVPELRNQERALATRVLTELGLEVQVIEEASREVAAGRVIRSDPVAGASVGTGGTVTLVISQGDLVAVPDIFNRSLPEARRMLEEAGLRLGSVNEQTRGQIPESQRPVFDRVRPGNVLSATPTYGTLVQRGSEVAVAIRKRD